MRLNNPRSYPSRNLYQNLLKIFHGLFTELFTQIRWILSAILAQSTCCIDRCSYRNSWYGTEVLILQPTSNGLIRRGLVARKSNDSSTTAPAALDDKPGKAPAAKAAGARAAFAALDQECDLYCAHAENDWTSSSEEGGDGRLASMIGGNGGGTG
jgi:hypothetical protein